MAPSDAQIAQLYAPIIRHEVSREAPHKDFILKYDFDRPEGQPGEAYWKWRDPKKKQRIELLDKEDANIERRPWGCIVTDASGEKHHLDLRAYVYYSVVRTATHNHICYAFYHPVDWKGIGSHSNDMEGAMVTAEVEGGRVVIVAAIEHLDINAGRLDERGEAMTDGRAHENEAFLWHADARRPLLHIETKGHGVWLNARARLHENDWHGTIEYQPESALQGGHIPPYYGYEADGMYSDRDRRVKRAYQLLPTNSADDPFAIWPVFKDIRPDGSIAMNPPWLWTHSGDAGLADRGEWFLDPAFYYAYRRGGSGRSWGDLRLRDDANSGRWALRYRSNPFLEYKLSAEKPFVPERGARMLRSVIKRRYRRNGDYFDQHPE